MAQWRDYRMAGLHLGTEQLHPVGWAAPSSHHLPRLGLNRPLRPNLIVHDAPALAGGNTSKQCLCFQVIPTRSSAASLRTFKLHNVNLVLCRPLLHLPNLPVLVHIDDVLFARVFAITCFAMENACAYTHAHKFSGIRPQSCRLPTS